MQFDFSRGYDILDEQYLRSLRFPYLCERGETSGADLMAIVGDSDALRDAPTACPGIPVFSLWTGFLFDNRREV